MTLTYKEVVVGPSSSNKPVDGVVFLLHGLGANAEDFGVFLNFIKLPNDVKLKFVIPNAPKIKVTINGGELMPAWYDVYNDAIKRKVDVKGVINSAEEIKKLIDQEVESGVDSKKIVVLGFSQGGVVAYHAALGYPKKLAGLVAISAYLVLDENTKFSDKNRGIKVKIDHGIYDQVVPEQLGKEATEELKKRGYNVTYTNYDTEHTIKSSQIEDVMKWILEALP